MPRIELHLPGEPKQQPENVADVYRITVERGDGIACSEMEAKTAMTMLSIEMVTNGEKEQAQTQQENKQGSRMSTTTHYENANFLRELAEHRPLPCPWGE